MKLKFKIAANTLVQILGKAIGAGVSLLITILVARKFGVEGYGEFTKIMAYITPFYLIADFGLNATILKKISTKNEETETFFSNLLGLRFLMSLLLIFLAVSILNFLPYNSSLDQGFSSQVKLGIIIFSLTILTQALFTTTNILFQKNLRYDLSVLSSIAGSLVILALVFSFTSLGASLTTVIASYIAGGVVMIVLSLGFTRRFLKTIRLSFNFSLWRKIFWETLPLGATLIFNLVYFRADMIILSFLRPNVEVSFYGLAYRFFEQPLAVITFFMNSIYPVMLWRAKEGDQRLRSLVRRLTLSLLTISIVFTVVFFISAPYLSLIRADFSPAIPALRILSFSFPFFFLSSLFMWTLIVMGKQKLLALFYGTSMVLNILLNFIFIPRYGYLAAAVITVFTELWVLALSGLSIFSFSTAEKENK